MTNTDHRDEPERLDTRRNAPSEPAPAGDAAEASVPADGTDAAPTSFEAAPTVIRARMLERLQEAVDSGDYRPDPGRIAESMMENERS